MQPIFPSLPRACRWLGPLALATLLLQSSSDARAALGDDVGAVAADQARLGAKVKVMRRPAYAVHELALPTGATVRELVGDAGKVFAVTWSGGWRPSLRRLLGAHYERFIAATRGRRATRGIVRIELPGMTVVMGGHLRTFFGTAVLTELLPAGVTLEELR
jgi:hypothetical protein